MADTDKLRNMLDNLINDKSEQAQVDFHDYLQGKMKDVTGMAPEDVPVPADETDSDKE